MKTKLSIVALTAALALAGPALAEDYDIDMLDKGEAGMMVFEPDFLKIEAGDTIRFLPTDKGHNAETVKGAFPEAAEKFKSKINEEFEVTLEEEGLYAIKCTPHVGTGMVMLVQVGDDTSNIDDIKEVKLPKKARERLDEQLENVEE